MRLQKQEKIYLNGLWFWVDEIERLVKKIRHLDHSLRHSNKGKRISPITSFVDQEIDSGVQIARQSFDKLVHLAKKPVLIERSNTIGLDFVDHNLITEDDVLKVYFRIEEGKTYKTSSRSFIKQFNKTLKKSRDHDATLRQPHIFSPNLNLL